MKFEEASENENIILSKDYKYKFENHLMKNSNYLYKSFSVLGFFYTTICRLFYLWVLYSAIIHFEENRLVISIVILIIGYFFVFQEQDRILVFNDRFVQRYGTFLNILCKEHVFVFQDIESIHFIEQPFYRFLPQFFPRLPFNYQIAKYEINSILMILNDGTEKYINLNGVESKEVSNIYHWLSKGIENYKNLP